MEMHMLRGELRARKINAVHLLSYLDPSFKSFVYIFNLEQK